MSVLPNWLQDGTTDINCNKCWDIGSEYFVFLWRLTKVVGFIFLMHTVLFSDYCLLNKLRISTLQFGAKSALQCQFASFGGEYWATLEQPDCSLDCYQQPDLSVCISGELIGKLTNWRVFVGGLPNYGRTLVLVCWYWPLQYSEKPLRLSPIYLHGFVFQWLVECVPLFSPSYTVFSTTCVLVLM